MSLCNGEWWGMFSPCPHLLACATISRQAHQHHVLSDGVRFTRLTNSSNEVRGAVLREREMGGSGSVTSQEVTVRGVHWLALVSGVSGLKGRMYVCAWISHYVALPSPLYHFPSWLSVSQAVFKGESRDNHFDWSLQHHVSRIKKTKHLRCFLYLSHLVQIASQLARKFGI